MKEYAADLFVGVVVLCAWGTVRLVRFLIHEGETS